MHKHSLFEVKFHIDGKGHEKQNRIISSYWIAYLNILSTFAFRSQSLRSSRG